MKEIYLENRGTVDGSECNKFFKLVEKGTQVWSYWGAIGAKGQEKMLLDSQDATERQAIWDKKLKEKLTGKLDKVTGKKNPYVIISKTGGETREEFVQRAQRDGTWNAPTPVSILPPAVPPVVTRVEARPSTEGRRWGVEVETHTNLDKLAIIRLMTDRGLKVKDSSTRYFDSTGEVWDLKRDGSCGYEFASPILSGEAGIFDAKLAVEKIQEVCKNAVNQKCGLHVTVDVSDHNNDDIKRFAIGYLKAQEHFYAECAEWRQHNQYCQRNPMHRIMDAIDSGVERALDACGGWRNHADRYHGMNFTRTFSHKVVEFRMMESTVAARKVGAWIRLCVGFIDGLKQSNVRFKTAEPFSKETFTAICERRWKV
jgi:predicted DNA-binding WGR domain protein